MKNRSIFVLTIFFSICLLLFACRRDIETLIEINQPKISPTLLESSRIFFNKSIAANREFYNQKGVIKLTPIWSEAFKMNAHDGFNYLIVPTVENYVNNREVNIRRVYLLNIDGNEIVAGRIVEFIGINSKVSPDLKLLVQNHDANLIPNFNGAVITYNLRYQWNYGVFYEDGVKSQDNVILAKRTIRNKHSVSPEGQIKTDILLKRFETVIGGGDIDKLEYLYSPNSIMGSGEGSGSSSSGGVGSGSSGGGSGSNLQEVNITAPGNPNPGTGGGSYGGNNTTNPGPIGGGGGVVVQYDEFKIGGHIEICSDIATTSTGNGYTGEIIGLGFTLLHKPKNTPTWVPVIAQFGVACIQVKVPSGGQTAASLKIRTAYKNATQKVLNWCRDGWIPVINPTTVRAAFETLMKWEIGPTGSLTNGSCSEIVPNNVPEYCL